MPDNLLALAVEAARHDATLGEISLAMEQVFGRYDTVPKPVSGVYSSAYEFDRRWQQVCDGVQAVARRLDRAPRVMIAKMGQDGHDRGAKVIATASSVSSCPTAASRMIARSRTAALSASGSSFGNGPASRIGSPPGRSILSTSAP